MAGLSPNSLNISRTKRAVLNTSHLVVHPEYEYWRTEWAKIRDAIAGEREIKRKAEQYLPRLSSDMDDEDYRNYLFRAVFYNMSGQTQEGMVGQVFRSNPVMRNMPTDRAVVGRSADGSQEVVTPARDRFTPQLRRFAKDGTSHHVFAKTACREQIALGRFGALVDASPDNPKNESYVVGYTAENIVYWEVGEVHGVYMPVRIILREFELIGDYRKPTQSNPWIGRDRGQTTTYTRNGISDQKAASRQQSTVRPLRYTAGAYQYQTIYRELVLEQDVNEFGEDVWVYRQHVYVDDPLSRPRDSFTPTIRGKSLDFIPFVFFGASSNTAECEKPPLLDIVDLNLKHYLTYAILEHGRFYTALPIYYAPGGEADNMSEYSIGPSTVWEVPVDGKPGILEFKGEGLKTLERALNEKEQQVAAIGGRLMPGASKSVSESDNQSALREANEQSLLMNVVMALEEGMSLLVRYWLMFRDVPLGDSINLRYEIDTSFLTNTADARTLRVIQQLYEAGIIDADALYENLVKNGLYSSTVTVDEFKVKLRDPASFIGQPDVEAARRGFTNRAQELEQTRVAREVEMEQRRLDLMQRQVEIDEEKLRIAAEVGSTSVAASRKLGDPEQAEPSKAEKGTLDVQKKQADAAAKAAQTAAKAPKSTPPKSST